MKIRDGIHRGVTVPPSVRLPTRTWSGRPSCASILLCLLVLVLPAISAAQSNERIIDLTAQLALWADVLALSSDGRYAIAGANDAIQLWDAERGIMLRKIAVLPPGEAIGFASFIPGAHQIVVTSQFRSRVNIVDLVNGAIVKSLLLNLSFFDRIEKAALVGNSRLLVAGSNTMHASMWDLHTGQRLFELIEPIPNPHQRGIANMLRNSITEVAASPDGTLIVGRSNMAGRLAMFQAVNGRFLDYFKVEEPRDYRHNSLLTFSSDGTYVVESLPLERGQLLNVWDVKTRAKVRSIRNPDTWKLNNPLVLDKAGSAFSRADSEGKLKGHLVHWDLRTGEVIRDYGDVSGFFIDPAARKIALSASERKLVIETIDEAKEVMPQNPRATSQMSAAQLSGDELLVHGGGRLGGAVFNLRSGQVTAWVPCAPIRNDPDLARSVRLCEDDKGAKSFIVRDIANARDVGSWVSETYLLTLTADRLIGFDSGEGVAVSIDFVSGRKLASAKPSIQERSDPRVNVIAKDASPDGRLLVGHENFSDSSSLFRIWSLETGAHLADLTDRASAKVLSWKNNKRVRASHGTSTHAHFHSGTARLLTVGYREWTAEDVAALGGRYDLKVWDYAGRLQRTIELGRRPVATIIDDPGSSSVLLQLQDGRLTKVGLTDGGMQDVTGPVPGGGYGGGVTADRQFVYVAGTDGVLTIVSAKTFKTLVRLVVSEQGDWLAITPEGFFAASPGGGRLLWLVEGLKPTSIQQVYASLYNPDLVRVKLAGDPEGEVKRAAEVLDLSKVIGSGPPPRVRIRLDNGAEGGSDDLVTVRGEFADEGGGIGRIEWRVNGITVGVDALAEGTGQLERRIALDPGENMIEVVAYNARNLVASLPAREHIDRPRSAEKTKPDLYVLAIGIDDYRDPGYTDVTTGLHERAPPLTLAVRDARAFADAMRRAGAAHYQNVNVTLALNSEATRDRLDAAIFALAKRVHPRDTFILYVAAHGRSHNGHFYIIPQDYRGGPNAVMQQGIGQETIQDWIANRVRAKKALVLIDACEAGALIAGHTSSRTSMPLSEAAIGRLHEATGRPVLTATAAGQFAVEGYKGHGVFTFAVLDALRHADSNGNGTIELSELAAHVQSLVPKLAPELDDPTIQQPRFGSRGEDFVIAGRLDD